MWTFKGPKPKPRTDEHIKVLEYLAKKGYNRTEAMLRKESAHADSEGRPIIRRAEDAGGEMYEKAYELLLRWVEKSLDIYKDELGRLLWPVFVHSFLKLAAEYFPRQCAVFFKAYREPFEKEHQDDIRALQAISLPEHVQNNHIAKLYRENHYRLTITDLAYSALIQFLEAHDTEGGSVILNILQHHVELRHVDRVASGAERSLARILAKQRGIQDVPAEDEGIPGHNPGSANTDRNAPPVLAKLALAPMPMEADLMEDVKAELQEHDSLHPPAAGRNTLVEEFEQRIKQEPNDDAPSRDQIPFPPSLARDVAMEVQRIKENRDRFKIESRTDGVGPGVSVTMFTYHNTFDSINCIEFSGDEKLAAVGTAESYIRVWSLDNKPLISPLDPPGQQPSSSRRLIGHSGPVYGLSFSPSIALPATAAQSNANADDSQSSPSHPRYLLSCSADSTIRLWSLDTFTNLVVYRSHTSPVWDVKFSPFGHYFVSSGADRTARMWSTARIAPLRLFVGHDSDVEAISWHPNSAYVFTAAGSPDRSIRMWDVQRGSAVRLFTGHTGNVTSLACAPNGKLVASADDRGEILLWDLATGRLVKRMKGHGRGGIWTLDWSIESTVLVSGGADCTVRVWDVQPPTVSNSNDAKALADGGINGKDGGPGAGGAVNNKNKKAKDVVVSPDQISAFPTKKSPVYKVRFTQMNLVMASGAYLP
ncbi:transcription initiation factor TFIID, subunit TAF5 [Aureobasidium pullulans]|nr:transcription initiation factor TFIID, subunit TAF5 [Aureobasidium pullulans]THY57874.1 transcription initiation factor TFIID, subunit TAF5 [Aureobasidium pullulans]